MRWNSSHQSLPNWLASSPVNERFDDFKERVEDAAIQAELETGEREETLEEAKTNALVRVGRMTLGFVVVIVGIAALPLPGPGWLIIAGGLTILSKDVAWADRLLRYIRKRVPGIPEDGKIPRSSMITMAVVTLAAVSASLWWTFGRGSEAVQAGAYTVSELIDPTASVPLDDEVTGIDYSDDGPFTITTSECGQLEFAVESRSKESFQLGAAPSTEGCSPTTTRLADAMDSAEISFRYATDGLVNWFLADNYLEAIVVDGDAIWRLDVAKLTNE